MRLPISLSIAGLYYHYKPNMPNHMHGYIKAEPNNPHDHNAIGIYSEEFGLIGYIQREDTSFVRAWSQNELPDNKCEIYLSVEPEWNRYFGSVFINGNSPHFNNHFNGKTVYLCKNGFSMPLAHEIIEGFGVKISSRLSKEVDFVIYEEEITDTVKKKIGAEGYKFSALTLSEFFQQAIPPEKRIADIYGRVVTPSSVGDSIIDNYLRSYIITEGGVYRKNYSKRETEIVLIKSEEAKSTMAKALNDGKKVIKCGDLIPELRAYRKETQNTDAIQVCESTSAVSQTNEPLSNPEPTPQKLDLEEAEKKSGIGFTWFVIIAVGILIYILVQ